MERSEDDPARTADPVASGDPATGALVLRMRGGDAGARAAFGELYALHASGVHAVLLGSVGVGEASDLVQEVFLQAWRSIEQLEDPERFGAWVAAIARNKARDLLRARGRQIARLSDVDEPADEGSESPSDPASQAGEEEEAARALAALRTLPEAYRETLAMRLVEGLAGREIARRTGMTYGSVRVNLCRGMKLLRERLAEVGVQLQPDVQHEGGAG